MLTLAVISCITAHAQAINNNLIGSWRLIYSKGKDGGNSFSADSSSRYQAKVITSTRFVLTAYSPQGDTLYMTFEGPITVSGNTYTETIQKSSVKEMLGMTYKYTSTVNGNKWRIEGGGNGLELEEEWIRID